MNVVRKAGWVVALAVFLGFGTFAVVNRPRSYVVHNDEEVQRVLKIKRPCDYMEASAKYEGELQARAVGRIRDWNDWRKAWAASVEAQGKRSEGGGQKAETTDGRGR